MDKQELRITKAARPSISKECSYTPERRRLFREWLRDADDKLRLLECKERENGRSRRCNG